MDLKHMILETRPQFLLLSPILVFLGMAIARYEFGSFDLTYFLLSIFGLVMLHASVDALNDYSDYKTGIDLKVNRTPFSGGSGLVPSGTITPRAAYWVGMVTFLAAVPVGVYFVAMRGWHLLPLFAAGAVFVLWYTSHITRFGAGSGEIAAGLGLGTLPVFGVFVIIANKFSPTALYAAVPSGFLVFNLLLLNEFPDREADLSGGRRTIPIQLGHRGAAWVYSSLVVMTYVWLVAGAILGLMPYWAMLGLLTLPLGVKGIRGAFIYAGNMANGGRGNIEEQAQDKMEEPARQENIEERARHALPLLIPAQGANVMMVLLTQLLMGVGYLAAGAAA
jgi:1,4-dihydroxy-2-naphthoate octaprenyltransferase